MTARLSSTDRMHTYYESDDDSDYDPGRSDLEGYDSDDGFVVPDDADTRRCKRRHSPFRSSCKKADRSEEKKILGIMAGILYPITPDAGEKVIGRDEEARAVASMVSQPDGGIRPLLAGASGVGKQAVVAKVAHLFQGARPIYCMDCSELIAHCPDTLMEDFKDLLDRALTGSGKEILYFKGIDKILNHQEVGEFIQSTLRLPVHFIASVSCDPGHETARKMQQALVPFNFYTLPIPELSLEEAEEVILRDLNEHPPHPSVQFTKKAVQLGVALAHKYESGSVFPQKGINLIQQSAFRILTPLMLEGKAPSKLKIGPQEIADYVSQMKGISAKDLIQSHLFDEEQFRDQLKEQVVGQDHALDLVAATVTRYKLGLVNPSRPWGVFLFAGSTGVGKTELAKTLAKLLFHDERALIRINGTEYQESHTASNLIGSPKGYEGHDEGGILTESLSKNPHQVVLFDEFEKAHTEVRKLLMPVLDDGYICDRKGKRIDCSRALFVMTSNLGQKELFELCSKKGMKPAQVVQSIIPILVNELGADLYNRFNVVVPFQPLKKEHLPGLVTAHLKKMNGWLPQTAQIHLEWTEEFVNHYAKKEFDPALGMRKFTRMLEADVLQVIQTEVSRKGRPLKGKVLLNAAKGGIRIQ